MKYMRTGCPAAVCVPRCGQCNLVGSFSDFTGHFMVCEARIRYVMPGSVQTVFRSPSQREYRRAAVGPTVSRTCIISYNTRLERRILRPAAEVLNISQTKPNRMRMTLTFSLTVAAPSPATPAATPAAAGAQPCSCCRGCCRRAASRFSRCSPDATFGGASARWPNCDWREQWAQAAPQRLPGRRLCLA